MTPERIFLAVRDEEENCESLARVLGERELADVWAGLAHQLQQIDTAHQRQELQAENRHLVAVLKRQIDLLHHLARQLDSAEEE